MIQTTLVFKHLRNNIQNKAEDRLDELFNRGVRTDHETLALLSIVPFFIRASAGALHETLANSYEGVGGGALVCAAWLAASTPSNILKLFVHSAGACKVLFEPAEIRLAAQILDAAVGSCLFTNGAESESESESESGPAKISPLLLAQTLQIGCYGDPTWKFSHFLTHKNMVEAAHMAVALS